MVITAVWLRGVCWRTRKYSPRCASASTTWRVSHSSAAAAAGLGRRPELPTGSEAKRAHLVAEALHACELDVFVTADQVGQVGQLHRSLVGRGRETRHRILDEHAVLGD